MGVWVGMEKEKKHKNMEGLVKIQTHAKGFHATFVFRQKV